MHQMKSENLWGETKSHNNKIKVVIITSAVTKITVGQNERWASQADFLRQKRIFNLVLSKNSRVSFTIFFLTIY